MYAEEYSEVMEKSVEEERRQAEEAAEAARLEAEIAAAELAAAEAAAQAEAAEAAAANGEVVAEGQETAEAGRKRLDRRRMCPTRKRLPAEWCRAS